MIKLKRKAVADIFILPFLSIIICQYQSSNICRTTKCHDYASCVISNGFFIYADVQIHMIYVHHNDKKIIKQNNYISCL